MGRAWLCKPREWYVTIWCICCCSSSEKLRKKKRSSNDKSIILCVNISQIFSVTHWMKFKRRKNRIIFKLVAIGHLFVSFISFFVLFERFFSFFQLFMVVENTHTQIGQLYVVVSHTVVKIGIFLPGTTADTIRRASLSCTRKQLTYQFEKLLRDDILSFNQSNPAQCDRARARALQSNGPANYAKIQMNDKWVSKQIAKRFFTKSMCISFPIDFSFTVSTEHKTQKSSFYKIHRFFFSYRTKFTGLYKIGHITHATAVLFLSCFICSFGRSILIKNLAY